MEIHLVALFPQRAVSEYAPLHASASLVALLIRRQAVEIWLGHGSAPPKIKMFARTSYARQGPSEGPMLCAVICTLGPSCRDVETLVELLEAGMTAARIDLTVSTLPSLHTAGCMA